MRIMRLCHSTETAGRYSLGEPLHGVSGTHCRETRHRRVDHLLGIAENRRPEMGHVAAGEVVKWSVMQRMSPTCLVEMVNRCSSVHR